MAWSHPGFSAHVAEPIAADPRALESLAKVRGPMSMGESRYAVQNVSLTPNWAWRESRDAVAWPNVTEGAELVIVVAFARVRPAA